ncbi:MAG: gibberellin regulated-like protein [Propionibacteriaceae bacterium]|nr:gibberellin regulated-like protein [Propionibacteriaceae bacterium]
MTHGRGLYATEVEAQQRAEQIGCATTHQIKDRWMPCSDERELHQQLRKQ